MTEVQLIVAADEPALFFASVQDAERHIEAVDVEAGVYWAAFGPAGEPYAINSSGPVVRIVRTDEAPRPDALKAVLRRHLDAIGETLGSELELPALLQRCPVSYR